MQVLIVDDDPLVLESCMRLLRTEGIPVAGVQSAAAARPRLAGGVYDVAVVDVKMPDEDGFSLVTWLRANAANTRCLVTSGFVTPETQSESRKRGADAFLPKPFTPNELLQAIQSLVDGT